MTQSLSSRRQRLLLGGLVLGLLGLACATSPTGRRQLTLFSKRYMAQLGNQSFAQMKKEQQVSQDVEINAYVECVTKALTSQLAPEWQDGWEVVVFEDDSANAFALPGRRIGVHTGLLEVAQTPDQLATVLGHEVSHVQAKHGNERLSQQVAAQIGLTVAAASTDSDTAAGRATLAALGLGTQYGVLLPFSRTHESEADLLGLEIMARSGFDPEESVLLWQNMAQQGGGQPPEWMSSHPSHRTRIDDLTNALPAAQSLRKSALDEGKRPDCPPPPAKKPAD
ncbi:MAG: M48 family metallopeptidase [Myxococcota bacterium]|nr:M48 family metallopeptidase [Myxococcota bacterium]